MSEHVLLCIEEHGSNTGDSPKKDTDRPRSIEPENKTEHINTRQIPADRAPYAAFYINLESRADRREQMERVLHRAGLGHAERVAALTPRDAEVAALAAQFPGKSAGYHANFASHRSVWRRIAATNSSTLTIIFEDDVVLHKDWQHLFSIAQETIRGRGKHGKEPTLDCFLLDGIFVTGEVSAEYGWLGPPSVGTHRAECMAYSSAYALSQAGAAWLMGRQQERPGYSSESYLMQLQEECTSSYTHVPRLALQRWDEAVSSVSGPAGAANMATWYQNNYFHRFPRALYFGMEEEQTRTIGNN